MKKIIAIILSTMIILSLSGCGDENKKTYSYSWEISDVHIDYSGYNQIETPIYVQGNTMSLFSDDEETYISVINKENCADDEWQKIVNKNHTTKDKNDNLYYTAEDPESKAYFVAFETGQVVIITYEEKSIVDGLTFYID